ncbi:MAG: cytochrome c oxidase assembly protein [Polymorphobacter sp.]|uniref:cytochrome c oxidase assembly protein n=1 Tax=Polymorphobacter sp. TaxID=1909290 RepID=UPI003A853D33
MSSAGLEAAKRRTGWLAALGAVTMIGAAYAAVPLYQLFCQVTGYNGTTSRADASALPDAATLGGETISVRFDASTAAGLPWRFKPKQVTSQIRIGEKALAYYTATNTSAKTITGRATYNVSPDTAGQYFRKIECFCFTEQQLGAGQSVDMPVIYYIDPAILDDPSANRISEITLSYTFFPQEP